MDVCENIFCLRNVKYCATIVLVLKHLLTYRKCGYRDVTESRHSFWELVADCHHLSVKSLLYKIVKQNCDWYHVLDS